MARLLDCFSALLSFGLALDASITSGEPALGCDAAQRRALELLDQARAAARGAGASPGRIESASYAIVGWIDEVLARHRGWRPGTRSLEQRLFNSSNAPSEFFHHLSALQADDHELREIYWRLLILGFKGQYSFESGDGGELGKLKDLHGRRLALGPLAYSE